MSLPVLTQYSLSQTSQLQVGILESVFHLVIQRLLFALDHDGGAAIQNSFWGAFHHQQMLGLCIRCRVLVNGKLGGHMGDKDQLKHLGLNMYFVVFIFNTTLHHKRQVN